MPGRRFLILKYIALFAVAYIGLMSLGGYIVRALDIQPPSMSNMLIIVASVLLTNALFTRGEKRSPSRNEYFRLVAGATLVDIALSAYSLLPSNSVSDAPIQWGTVVLITFCHSVLFVVGFFPRGNNPNARSPA